LADGVWVVLFPEGTRAPVGEQRAFGAGGAALARAAKRPVLVVAHNAGLFWPAHEINKRSGTIRLQLSPLIATEGLTSKQINARAEAWLAETMPQLEAHSSIATPVVELGS
jgi:1-acyl-sn-glycerol-3-phosphate acyltransferase